MNYHLPALYILFSLFVLGCGDEKTDSLPQDDLCSEPEIGCFDSTWSAESSSYRLQLLSASPLLPERGSNEWLVELTSKTNESLDSCEVNATPYMPEHGHGAPAQPQVMKTPQSDYLIQEILFTMPGLWELTFDIQCGETSSELVIYSFWLEA